MATRRPRPTAPPAGSAPAAPAAGVPSDLRPGAVRPRPARGASQMHPGVAPLSALTHRTQLFQPLPAPLGDPPYHVDINQLVPGLDALAAQSGQLVLHAVGDTGGINTPDYQRAVAAAMKGDLNLPPAQRPAFFYHLGDVVYYNGEIAQYYPQFYEPYDHYDAPIVAIPGNHDGDPVGPQQTSLDGWVRYFMAPGPVVQPESHDAPRVTLSLPNVYFTLNTPFATFVGIYSNVPEGGSIDSVQQQWLTHEFATAPLDKALIFSSHHPIYSFDDHHSGSARMADALQQAINDSRRVPNLVLAAHVHNYQRIERPVGAGGPTPFVVAGHGGYFHLHGMNADPGTTDPATQAHLVAGDHLQHGYLRLTLTAATISGVAVQVPSNGAAPQEIDSFSYPAAARLLPASAVVSL